MKHIRKFCGALNRSEAEVKAWENNIKEARIKSTAAFEDKLKRMFKAGSFMQ